MLANPVDNADIAIEIKAPIPTFFGFVKKTKICSTHPGIDSAASSDDWKDINGQGMYMS